MLTPVPPLGEDEAARGGVEDGDGEDTAGDTQPPEIQRGQCQCFRQTQQRGKMITESSVISVKMSQIG